MTAVLSSVGGLDCTLDSFNFSPFAIGKRIQLDELRVWGTSTGATNTLRVLLRRYTDGVGFSTIWDNTVTGITSGEQFHNHRNMAEVINLTPLDLVFLSMFTQRITGLRYELRGTQL